MGICYAGVNHYAVLWYAPLHYTALDRGYNGRPTPPTLTFPSDPGIPIGWPVEDGGGAWSKLTCKPDGSSEGEARGVGDVGRINVE